MKQARYSFAKAPDHTCSRRQALQCFTAGSTLPDADTMLMVRRWAGGLDLEETSAGDAFRAQVAAASEVVIELVDPPPPPPPPVLVAISLERGDALLTADVLRLRAEQISASMSSAGTERAAALVRIAETIEAAVAKGAA